jgi:glycine cleavage system regulatory protein
MVNTPEASGILVAIGRDRPGLANAVAAFVHACECTIDDADMETLRAYFAILLRFCGTNQAVQKVRNDAKSWGDNHGLAIQLYDDLPEYIPTDNVQLYELRVDAVERLGIIDDLTRDFQKHDVNIRELDSRIKEMPETGILRYVLTAMLQIPASKIATVRDALNKLELDYDLRPR